MRDLYRRHVDRLEREVGAALAAAGRDELIVHAGTIQLKSPFDDACWPFRPTPAYAHWVHDPAPGHTVVLRPGERPRLHRPPHASFWEGAPPAPPDWMLEPFAVVDAAVEPGPGRVAFIGDDGEAAAALGIAAAATNPADLIDALHAIRAVKSDYEIECIAEANRVALRGHRAVAEAFAARDRSELELHLRYLEVTGQDDAETPYKNIVARGRNAAVLHHIDYTRDRGGADSLLVDAGATCRGYASDITRTHSRDTGGRFAALIAAVEQVQRQVIAEIAAGLEYEALHDRSHVLLAAGLREIGLARGDDAELVDTGITRAFFPHGLGHALGVQVHDVGCRPRDPAANNPYLRHTASIEPGQVFTIEPGCYFIDSLLEPLREAPAGSAIDWNAVAELRPFGGVRIEDNIAVIADGSRNLTRDNSRNPP
jgi:Xaa-Pro dipeptidase